MPSHNSRPTNRPSQFLNATYRRTQHSDNNRGITEAWMAFQRFRPFPSQSAGSAKSWPLPRPAGASLDLQQRAVSTAEPRPRTLPPIHTNVRPGNRKVHNMARPKPSENSAWARRWATQRSHHSAICNKAASSRSASSTVTHTPYSGVRPSGRKKKITNASEKDIAIINRLQGIYGNKKDRVSRAEKVRESLGNLERRIMHTEINTSLRNYAKKVEEEKRNRRELKRVRDRYTKDKERRNRYSFVSLNALEAPQVPRKAYGLPNEGREMDTSNLTKKTQSELKNIWQKSMRRIALVQGLVKISPRESGGGGRLSIKPLAKKDSKKDITTRSSSESEESKIESSEPVRDKLAAVMGEIDAMYTAISDSEDELSDIAEE